MANVKKVVREVPIIELGEGHANDAAAILALAFQDDPVLVHACPDEKARARLLPWMFRWSIWKGLRFGHLLGTAGSLDGVAALVGPDGGDFTAQDLTHIDHVRAREVIGPELWDGVLAVSDVDVTPAEAALHRAVPEPHWYLDALAVNPERQGQGIGSALLRAAVAYAEADGLPLVLLTCQPRNVPLYQRHGFEVVCHIDNPESPVQWWGMRRPAHS